MAALEAYAPGLPEISPDGDSDETALLSKARAQKFALLLHLAANLPQPVLVSGPVGIGKTVFLRRLAEAIRPFATPCPLAATPGTSYERILEALQFVAIRELPQSNTAELDLAGALASYARERRLLALLLDDADALLPGLLNALCEFARQNPSLRLIFALSDEAARRKSTTDGLVLREAYPLEIPALAEAEASAYLRTLAANRPVPRRWYARTQGHPGTIVQWSQAGTLPDAAQGWPKTALWLGTLAGMLAVGTVLALLWKPPVHPEVSAPPPSHPEPEPAQPPVPQNPAPSAAPAAATPQPAPAPPDLTPHPAHPPASPTGLPPLVPETPLPVIPEPEASGELTGGSGSTLPETRQTPPAAQPAPPPPATAEPPPTPHGDGAGHAAHSEAPATAAGESGHAAPAHPREAAKPPVAARKSKGAPKTETPAKPATPEPVAGADKPPEPTESAPDATVAIEGVKSADWLLAQNPEDYTLQVVAMSQLSALSSLVGRFPPDSTLAAVRSRKGRGDLYLLFYGLYPNLAAARDGAATVPTSLGRPVPRQLRAIQVDILKTHAQRGAIQAPHAARYP